MSDYRLQIMNAPKRWLDRLAKWWLGPPLDVRRIECPDCHRYTVAWRRYTDGTQQCIRCAEGLPVEGAVG